MCVQSSSPSGATLVCSFDVLEHILDRQIFRLAAMSVAEAMHWKYVRFRLYLTRL